MSKQVKIAVIGCGVIGLTTAIEIHRKFGHQAKVVIIADKFTPNTTSDIAAGLWEPYLLAENNEEDVIRWSSATYQHILNLWKQGKANETGICLQPIINLFDCRDYSIPKWATVTLGYNELSDRHLQSLNKQYGRSFTGGFMFVGFTWEPAIFLPCLQEEFTKMGGEIMQRHVNRLTDLEGFSVVVNCTGLGARPLLADDTVIPIRGQIMRVKAPWQHISYLVNCENATESCYIIPNRNFVVLGGTKQESFNTTVDPIDSQQIENNVSKLCPGITREKRVEIVGLRPSRYKVKLEYELADLGCTKDAIILHNYGHGGSGITLSIGCAKEVAELLDKLLRLKIAKL